MGVPNLPEELLLLTQEWPCRETQVRQLASLLPIDDLPRPSTIVVHGPRATGKSSLVSAYLERHRASHAVVHCRECITGRHLLERTVAAVHSSLRTDLQHEAFDAFHGFAAPEAFNGRCENLSSLTVHLQRLLAKQDKFVLVFDGVDKQRDAPPTLLPALARLGEFVPNLTSVLIVQHASAHALHKTGVPHIHFAPYSRNQSIHIISGKPHQIFLDPPPEDMEYDDEQHEEDTKWLWPRFCAAVWDSLGQTVARDLVAFREVCYKLWRPFVAPIVKGDFGTRDFSRLLVAQRRLFQEESVLLEFIISEPPKNTQQIPSRPAIKSKAHELPYYAKWLLVAAYLASFTPPKMDAIYFMKSSDRKKRKKGGGGRAGRPSQTRKVPRHLLAPSAFPLDRLLSILHAILPHDLRTTIDIYTQVATLASLRLLVRSGGIGGTGGDPLERGGKWRVGGQIGWEFVLGLARSVQFDVGEYVAD